MCFPPDVTRRGFYWLRRDAEWNVWEWVPECRCWWAYTSSIEPDYAADTGWRVTSPAVPPCEGVGGAADARLEGARQSVEARPEALPAGARTVPRAAAGRRGQRCGGWS